MCDNIKCEYCGDPADHTFRKPKLYQIGHSTIGVCDWCLERDEEAKAAVAKEAKDAADLEQAFKDYASGKLKDPVQA